jgi:hypothetical protein
MRIELRTGRRHQVVIDTAESLDEALSLAAFYVNDPRDVKAPERVFLWDVRAAQYCGWATRKTTGARR